MKDFIEEKIGLTIPSFELMKWCVHNNHTPKTKKINNFLELRSSFTILRNMDYTILPEFICKKLKIKK